MLASRKYLFYTVNSFFTKPLNSSQERGVFCYGEDQKNSANHPVHFPGADAAVRHRVLVQRVIAVDERGGNQRGFVQVVRLNGCVESRRVGGSGGVHRIS